MHIYMYIYIFDITSAVLLILIKSLQQNEYTVTDTENDGYALNIKNLYYEIAHDYP